MILGINASRCRSGGARAHLIGILMEGAPLAHGITSVHVWSYPQLLDDLPDRPWLVRHGPKALSGSLLTQLMWERFSLPGELKAAGCSILFNVDAGTVSTFSPAITMSQDMLSYEPGEMERFGYSKARVRLLLLRYMQNRSLRSAEGVIFLTRYASTLIQESCGPLENCALIPHGIGSAFKATPAAASWPGDGSRSILCLYVSPIWLFKHQWVTVRAIEMLRANGYDVVLTLAGGGDDDAKARLDRQIAASDPGGVFVKLLGHVEHKALPALLAGADIFVFASSCENMPITVLEGMTVGLPIACSDRGPMPEVLGDGGVYFDPEDPCSIAAVIEALITSPELRARIAQRAHELSTAYSWTRCANETFAFAADTYSKYRAAS